ncbi:hypothetical protein C8R44DRAFT_760144 [Mycena epipterygia]|nr:hypothetical protein C8R44DRAFT_760144 [Mycena epipterygia]
MVPQELIDAIVREVDAGDDLKAYSLVSSSFLVTSQRILFHHLHLCQARARVWNTRLTKSPHIAGYITALSISLCVADTTPTRAKSLRKVLGKIANIRRCTIMGDDSSWNKLSPSTELVLEFLGRQKLTTLCIASIRSLPPAAVVFFLHSVPAISFWDVTVSTAAFKDSPAGASTSDIPKLNQFSCYESASVCDLLASPGFSRYTANLRRLDVPIRRNMDARLISITARSLEHIRVCIPMLFKPLKPLPPLSVLRSIDVWKTPQPDDETWFINCLAPLLISSPPTLEEMTITYWHIESLNPPYFQSESLAVFNRALSNCPESPRLRWRLHFADDDDSMCLLHLSDFATFMQRSMPGIHEQGRLIVEHSESDSFEKERDDGTVSTISQIV